MKKHAVFTTVAAACFAMGATSFAQESGYSQQYSACMEKSGGVTTFASGHYARSASSRTISKP